MQVQIFEVDAPSLIYAFGSISAYLYNKYEQCLSTSIFPHQPLPFFWLVYTCPLNFHIYFLFSSFFHS